MPRLANSLSGDSEPLPERRTVSPVEDGSEKFRLLVESVRDYAIIMLDVNGRVVAWNPGAEHLFGYSAEAILGQHLSRLYPAGDQEIAAAELQKAESESYESEGWRLRRDGTRFWAHALTTALRDREGRHQGFARMTRDLSEKRSAEAALTRQAALINLALDAIFVHDLDHKIIFWNRGAEELYGWKETEVLGRSPHDLLETKFPLPVEEIRAELLAKDRWEGEITHKTRSGRTIDVTSRWSLQRDENGNPAAILEITRDITERKRAEGELRKLAAELERRVAERTTELRAAYDELEAFAYSVSHDLRAPLRAMGGLSQALLEDYADHLDETGKEYAEHIRSSAEHMDRLILDLLAYSRLGRERITLSAIQLDAAVKQALAQIRDEVRRSHASIAIEEPLPTVMAHRQTLVQLIVNLLSNAIKFVREGVTPTVRVRAETERERVCLWVEDKGIGIAPEHHERIFKVFERLHGIEAYPGTGIGLSIVRKGAERMGGKAGVESAPGRGSRFWLELPLAKREG
jgi:PAS domain S-box-containing protein